MILALAVGGTADSANGTTTITGESHNMMSI